MEKEKYQIEVDLMSTPPAMLWSLVSSASGLQRWFADEVRVDGRRVTFRWNDGTEQSATLLSQRAESMVRMRWEGDPPGVYFEMRILTSELTDSTSLLVVDFAPADEVADARELWLSQLDALRTFVGCL